MPTDPRLIYMILVLPGLFGLTLLGDGINKLVHDESGGVVNVVFGFIFIGVVIFAFFFFTVYLNQKI